MVTVLDIIGKIISCFKGILKMKQKKEKNSAMKKKCTFDIDGEECNCILHCKKNNWDNQKVMNFWETLREEIKNQNKSPFSPYYEFKNVIFPKFENFGLAQHKETEKSGNSFFNKSEKKEFNKKFKLIDCTFLDEADFSHIKFLEGLTFDNCIFENGLVIKNSNFDEYEKVRIQNCPKIVNANFKNTTFSDLADFYNSVFIGEKTTFEKTTFLDIVVFSEGTFKVDIDFKYTTFNKLAQFKNTKFEKELNLEDSIIKEEANFLHIKQKDGKNLKSENIANRETARIIKNSFEKQNNIIEANKFYALEMEKEKEELTWKENFIDKLIFTAHVISSNHSQNPLRVLFWIIIFGILSATIDFFSMTHFGIYIHNKPYMMMGLIIFGPLIFCIVNIFKNKNFTLSFLILFLMISSYSLVTKDFCTYFSLFAKTINPFSRIFSGGNINLIQLVFKVIFAYLYYQFIVSIRQNTRRK